LPEMKKKIMLAALLLVFTAPLLLSQNKAFQFGFKVGPNIGWIKPDAEGYERLGVDAGFAWGFVAEVFLLENYAMNTGFDVVYLNGSFSYPHQKLVPASAGGNIKGVLNRSFRTKYIQLPLLLKMKTNDFGKFRYYGQVGFGLAFLADAKSDDRFYSQGLLIEEKTFEIEKQLRFTRESLILGAGVEYSLGGSTFLTAGIKFDNNFIDVLKDQNTIDPMIEHKAITNFLELQIGLLF